MARQVGRYQIHDAIASGGMAAVHLGRMVGPMGFARTVAIKCLHPQFAQDGEFAMMLLDEARVSARIQHPFVVQTLDVVAEGGELLVVMEYIHGESLAKLARRARDQGRRIDPEVAVTIVTQVLYGLHTAHEVSDDTGRHLGVVHRDVSPQNVMVGADGIARILDFGVAKALGRAQTTREGQIKGKLAYMSPEQFQSGIVDRRTDVFAAAIVLWELLVGQRLFHGDDPKITIGNLLRCKVDAPSSGVAGVDPALDSIVLKGLASEPSARYATAEEMARALEAWRPAVSATRVAAWVDSLCHEELSIRRARIAEVERSGSISKVVLRPDEPAEETKSTHTSSARITVAPPRSRRGWTWMAPLAIVTLIVAYLGLLRPRAPLATGHVDVAPSGGGPTFPAPTGSASKAAAAGPAASSAEDAAAPPSADAAPLVTSTPVSRAPKRTSPSETNRAGHDDCATPYTLDSEGHKHYKRECLRNP